MVFQLNAQIPIAYRGYDYGRSQQNALRSLQMEAAERQIDEQNALAQVYQQHGAGLAADDPAKRAAAAGMIAGAGPRGYAMAAPILQRARDERAVAGIFGGGGAAAPAGAAPAGATPAAMPGGATPAVAPADLMPLIEEASRETGIPVPILVAQIRQESNFNPAARGRAGEIGLAQIMPATARQPGFGVQPVDPARLSDPRENIMFGARYLAGRGRALGVTDWNDPAQVDRALAAYNGGGDPNYVQNVRRWMPGTGGAPAAGGDVIPASAQGGGERRMPGQPTQAQFAQLMQQAAAGNEVAQRLVQNWLPFMRQETANPPAPVRLGDGPAGPAGMYIPDPSARGGYRRVADAPPDANGSGMTPARAQQILPALAPRIASGQATEQEVREYLSAAQVASFRVAENGMLVRMLLPAFAPPPEAVLQMYPGIAFQMPAPGAPAGAAPSAAPGAGAPQAAPMVAPQAAPQTPAAAGDAAPATVQLPPPPGPTMPGPGGGVSRPPGPGSTVSNQIEERQFNVAEQVSRLEGIRRGFRPEHQTFSGRWSNMWAALRERGGQQLPERERQRLVEYTQSRARSLENLNMTIQAMTGAAMGVEEAQRIIATMPNPGSGLFDGDSPTEFQAKLDRATQDARNAAIRYSIARQRGLDPLRSGIRLEEVPAIVNRRGEEIAREIRSDNPQMRENEVQQQTQLRLGAELGLR